MPWCAPPPPSHAAAAAAAAAAESCRAPAGWAWPSGPRLAGRAPASQRAAAPVAAPHTRLPVFCVPDEGRLAGQGRFGGSSGGAFQDPSVPPRPVSLSQPLKSAQLGQLPCVRCSAPAWLWRRRHSPCPGQDGGVVSSRCMPGGSAAAGRLSACWRLRILGLLCLLCPLRHRSVEALPLEEWEQAMKRV